MIGQDAWANGEAPSDKMPEHRWALPAPESLVLLWGAETGDAWALKFALLELVVRRTLWLAAVEERRLLRGRRFTDLLGHDRPADPDFDRPLRSVVESIPKPRAYADGVRGVPVEDLAEAVLTRTYRRVRVRWRTFRWDRSGGGYVQAEILPALESRGLFVRDPSGQGLFAGGARWALTPSGSDALRHLWALIEIGRGPFGEWAQRDPTRAAAYVERAGPALLLQPGLTTALRSLRGRIAEVEAGGWAPTGFASDPFGIESLDGAFGPNPGDGLDAAFHAIAEDVDRAWDRLHRRGGGLFLSGGE